MVSAQSSQGASPRGIAQPSREPFLVSRPERDPVRRAANFAKQASSAGTALPAERIFDNPAATHVLRPPCGRVGVAGNFGARVFWYALALLIGLMCFAAFSSNPAHAQSCTIDSQCSGGGRSVATCQGDMLVVRSARCIGGSCQEREERRQNCGPRSSQAVSCAGNVAVRGGGGCDPVGQSCSTRTDREVCSKSCACVKNRLIVSTGQCSPGAGCARAVIQCQSGCTCSGEPRCL